MSKDRAIPGIVLAESGNSEKWIGLKATAIDWQPVNRNPLTVKKSDGIILGYRLEGAIKSTYRLGEDRWRNQNCLKDDFMIVRAHEDGQWSWKNMSGADDSLLTMLINIEQSLIDSVASQVFEIDYSAAEFSHLINQRDPFVKDIIKRLLYELKNDDPLSKFSIDLLKQELVVHLLRHYSVFNHRLECHVKGLSKKQLRRVNDYIESYFHTDISLKELAGLISLSEYHFARLYKQSTKVTPYQYILTCRFKRAQQLLVETSLTTQQIAFQVGYKDDSTFNKAFSKYYGVPPGIYRKYIA